VTDLRTTANASKAWPYEEARKLLKRVRADKPMVFETGYGPSGLPHIGTFNEVLRTTMVRNAFDEMTEHSHKIELIAFSDDMDGLQGAR
jgi:lysyl-tRNA synthetase, class I